MNTHALLRASVRTILESAAGRPWSAQGLGMLRLYLTPEIRLHVWDSRLKVPDVSTIHDHPWDFRSYVVAGVVRQYRFAGVFEPGSRGRELHRRQAIRCGPGGCAIGEPVVAELFRNWGETYRAGTWYEQLAEEVHESLPEDGTVTLVERHFRSDTEHASVYFQGAGWVSAEPRPATLDEVAATVALALARWDA